MVVPLVLSLKNNGLAQKKGIVCAPLQATALEPPVHKFSLQSVTPTIRPTCRPVPLCPAARKASQVPPFKPKTSVKCRHSEERCPHLQFLKGSSTPNLHRTKPSQAHFKHQLLYPISSPPPSCQAIHTYKPLHRTNLVPLFRLRIIQKLHSSSDRTQKQHPPFHSTQVLTPQQPKTLPGDKKSWH